MPVVSVRGLKGDRFSRAFEDDRRAGFSSETTTWRVRSVVSAFKRLCKMRVAGGPNSYISLFFFF